MGSQGEDRLDPLGTLVPQVLFPLLDFVENWEVGEEASDSELRKVGEAGLHDPPPPRLAG